MKLSPLFEEVLSKTTDVMFNYETDDEWTTIMALLNGKEVGKVVIEFVMDGYREFEDIINDPNNDFTDQDYDKIFPNDRFAEIEYLYVDEEFRGSGIARKLLDKAKSYAKKEGENVLYLNASPMGVRTLNLMDLVGFYKSYGFQEMIVEPNNVEMFMNI